MEQGALTVFAVTIAAIGSGGLALLVLLVAGFFHFRRRGRSGRSAITSRTLDVPRSSYSTPRYPGYGGADSEKSPVTASAASSLARAYQVQPAISPSPLSTGSTLVGTPNSRLRKGSSPLESNRDRSRAGARAASEGGPGQRGRAGSAASQIRADDRPESQAIMITYEEGLARLGLQNPSAAAFSTNPIASYPSSDPPHFDSLYHQPSPSQGRPGRQSIAPYEHRLSPRAMPGRVGLVGGAAARHDRTLVLPSQYSEYTDGGREISGPAPPRSVPGLQTGWLPTYYQIDERAEDESYSELDYRDRWAGNRI